MHHNPTQRTPCKRPAAQSHAKSIPRSPTTVYRPGGQKWHHGPAGPWCRTLRPAGFACQHFSTSAFQAKGEIRIIRQPGRERFSGVEGLEQGASAYAGCLRGYRSVSGARRVWTKEPAPSLLGFHTRQHRRGLRKERRRRTRPFPPHLDGFCERTGVPSAPGPRPRLPGPRPTPKPHRPDATSQENALDLHQKAPPPTTLKC
jgi:hypothetical protein